MKNEYEVFVIYLCSCLFVEIYLHGSWPPNTRVLLDIAPCSLVETDRCFRGPCCPHQQGDAGGSTHL
jgi:hypothetical protein